MTARFLAMTVLVAVMGAHADAQELASDLNQLRVLVKAGDSLTVTDTGGQRTQGRLVQLDASAIVLELPNKQRQQFDGAMVDTVEGRRGDSLKNGALMGLISGGALGIWAGISDANYYEENLGPEVIVAPVLPARPSDTGCSWEGSVQRSERASTP